MDTIQTIWIQLARDATSLCQEPSEPLTPDGPPECMSYDLFARIMERARAQSWRCILLGGQQGLPQRYQRLCAGTETEVVLPSICADVPGQEESTVVLSADEGQYVAGQARTTRAILRIRRARLSDLSRVAIDLLVPFPDLSLRHPELLTYDDGDLAVYQRELMQVGRWLLEQGERWPRYRLDCLTDRLRGEGDGHCGAGHTKLAVGLTGQVYLCPAALRRSEPSYGHVLAGVEIPNRQLFTKRYSTPCMECDALHCLRCVYLNKRATLEYCVPPRVACRLAHVELAVQAWFAGEALQAGLWNSAWFAPAPPTLDDPYELVKKAWAPSVYHTWQSLVRLGDRPEGLNPSVMLFIIHGLHGWCQTLAACAGAGCVPPLDLLSKDRLVQIRRQTIERYKDTAFAPGGPTVGEVEWAMWRALASSRGS
jgi:CXXX repeat peptide maturase